MAGLQSFDVIKLYSFSLVLAEICLHAASIHLSHACGSDLKQGCDTA